MSIESTTPVPAGSGNIESHVNREVLRHLVSRAIFCPATGKVLDVSVTVAVEASDPATSQTGWSIMHADHYDAVEADKIAAARERGNIAITVYDGRILFGGKV